MAYTLKQDANGLYTLDTQDVFKSTTTTPPKFDTSEFEAYTPKKTELVGGTNLAEQTKTIMREMPGQIETVTDPETGEVKTVQKGAGKVELKESQPITSLQTTTGAAVKETPLDKVSRIMQQFPSGQAGGGFNTDEYFSRIEQIQKNQQKAELTNRLISGAFDIGVTYLKGSLGGFSTGGITGGTSSFTPLTGGAYAPSSAGGFFTSPAGGGILSAGATLLSGGSPKQAAATGVGTAIGTAVGGPIGGAIGGAIGSVIGCFLPDTLITMADGSKKKVIDIDIKDNIEVGGLVFATGKFLINNLFDYKGIKVSGEHLVNENGKWLKVKQSQFAKSLGNDEHIVYTLGSQNRRILINDILFTDYFDFEEQKTLAA